METNTEVKTTLQRFCVEEAQFRAEEAGYELSEKEIELLSEKFYERSESWIKLWRVLYQGYSRKNPQRMR